MYSTISIPDAKQQVQLDNDSKLAPVRSFLESLHKGEKTKDFIATETVPDAY